MVSFTATGDSLILDHLPSREYITPIKEYIGRGDVRITNLETVLIDDTCFANTFNGGGHVWSPPYVLDDIKGFGFNALSWANNHTMDFSYNGVNSTVRYIKEAGLQFAGAGNSLYEASMPCFINTTNGRVALLAQAALYKSQHGARAGESHDAFPPRPGLNILRYNVEYTVTTEQMEVLRQVVRATNMDADDALAISQGFIQANVKEILDFDGVKLRCGEENGRVSTCNQYDLDRMTRHIQAARSNSDYVVVSIHSHQMKGRDEYEPDYFLEDYAHKCIDAGACAIIGGGTHLLRGIEIYKGKPIFYSLGNFIFQNRFATRIPMDIVESRGYDPLDYGAEAMFVKRKPLPGSLSSQSKYFKTVIPYWEMNGGNLTKLELLPIELGHSFDDYAGYGVPYTAEPESVYRELCTASAPYGTNFEVEGNIIRAIL